MILLFTTNTESATSIRRHRKSVDEALSLNILLYYKVLDVVARSLNAPMSVTACSMFQMYSGDR